MIIILSSRLILLVKESNAYSHTGVPPTWKAGIL
jgi:hypothetical protein